MTSPSNCIVFRTTSLAETPHRQTGSGRYSCAACDGAGFADKYRYRELTETPGPLFISASRRSPLQEAMTPPYVLTITNNNRMRGLERMRQQRAEKAPNSRRSTSSALLVEKSPQTELDLLHRLIGHMRTCSDPDAQEDLQQLRMGDNPLEVALSSSS